MKTYREELTGAIKGNARLRNRLDAATRRIKELEMAVRLLVDRADRAGRGDDEGVIAAAATVGWRRDESIAQAMREAMQ